MQWTEESHVSAQQLNSLRGLNHRFLDLTGASADAWGGALTTSLARQVAPLSSAQRAAAADCPYALFDLRFEDTSYWTLRLQSSGAWRVADELNVESDTGNFVRLALFYAWHLASSGGLAAQILLGMHHDTAEAFRRVDVNRLPTLAMTEAANLTPRWSSCNVYWSALTSAASRPDSSGLRRVQLYGLQLAAAARLPSA